MAVAILSRRAMKIHDWTFDAERNLLRRGSVSVRLEPKAADVLRALHASRGTVLTKEALIRGVWGDVAISDDVLTTTIYQLRRALGDDRHAPRYIETIPRRGYRLLPEPPPEPRQSRPRWPFLVAGVLVVAVLATAALLGQRRANRLAAAELHQFAAGTIARGEDLHAAVTMLRRASELDPADTKIAGSLALALALASEDRGKAEEARAAANRALERDPSNPQARVARAIVALWTDWNWDGAASDLRSAAATGDPLAVSWLAFVSSLRGDRGTAARLANTVAGPPIASSTASSALLLCGLIDEAERVAERALRAAPSNALLAKQIVKTRERRLERAGATTAEHDVRRPTDVARLHLAYGNADAALNALEDALRQRDRHLLFLRVDTRWEPIRGHARFQAIVAAVGL
ncbi:MAG TPA: winged helix-turn-helix domain-containing protein [Thermoanaerobaculia bacterium]